MKSDIINTADSYKHTMFRQYPPKMIRISSYIESRGGDYDFTLFNGLQPILSALKAPTRKQVNQRAIRYAQHGISFDRDMWLAVADLGYLPLKIQAVREGTILPTKNVLVQTVNTDDRFAPLTTHVETKLLKVWYPITVATRSRKIKNILKTYLALSSDDASGLDFMLHDFGYRGVSSDESAAIGGCAHLINFKGTDTGAALDYAEDYYSDPMAGFSVDAMEHSTVTSWGRDREKAAYENMINNCSKPGAIYSIVSDSYDIFNAVSNLFGEALKDKIIEGGGRLVIRPDSGDPVKVNLKILSILEQKFGMTVNSKGYKVLPSFLRILQGDGVNEHSIEKMCSAITKAGYSIENMVFGMGGELLQNMNRDTLKFAMKASAIKTENDYWADVVKDPITDPGKRSKAGRLALVYNKNTGWETIRETDLGDRVNMLEDVFENGKILRDQTLSEIRALAETDVYTA